MCSASVFGQKQEFTFCLVVLGKSLFGDFWGWGGEASLFVGFESPV